MGEIGRGAVPGVFLSGRDEMLIDNNAITEVNSFIIKSLF